MLKVKQVLILLSCLSVFGASGAASARIDDSISIFFPKELRALELTQTQFPLFWWNFVVIEADASSKFDFKQAQKICDELSLQHKEKISKIVCGGRFDSFMLQLKEWGEDFPRRTSYVRDQKNLELNKQKFDESMAKLSMMSNADITDFIRHDPFLQWIDFTNELQKMSGQAFKMFNGFLVDEDSKRIIIPVQFKVAPKRANVDSLMQGLLLQPNIHILGAHASSYINETQVMDDLNIVSSVGLVLLVGFALFLILKGRKNIIFLYIPVFAAMGFATLITELIYGSIHGLTLAFGSGIIGLVLDYGLHGAFNVHSKQTWKSNSVGLVTTLIGLSGLVFCSIPLIQQMMVFSILGLGIGYLLFYYLCHAHVRYFAIDGLLFNIPHWRLVSLGSLFFSLLSLLVGFQVSWTVDLKSMNFSRPGDFEIASWFYQKNEMGEMMLAIQPTENLKVSEKTQTLLEREYSFAQDEKVNYDGLARYLPSINQQQENLNSWAKDFCPRATADFGLDRIKMFAPFVQMNCQQNVGTIDQRLFKIPSYLQHLQTQNQLISVFFAKSPDEKEKIKANFPYFESIQENLTKYSNIFEGDLRRIMPLTFLVCILMLFIYYRRFLFVFSSILPFFCGTGIFFVYQIFFGKQIDLMGLVGLIMVFCFSLDYGVFATDIVVFPQAKENSTEIRSSLTFAALSNLLGYFPMIFAKHVVLHNLGVALFLGTVGAYVGSIWGTPTLLNWRLRK